MHPKHLTAMAWTLVALFALTTGLRPFVQRVLPPALSTALITLLPLAFFVIHGLLNYRARDLLVFAALTLVVSNIFENLSILTGFPFGFYDYSDVLGPRLFLVPVLIGPAYLATGYLSWTLANVLVGQTGARHQIVTVPLVASLAMVSWDLAFDPVYSTVFGSWVWPNGGSYFGVPLSNFVGWGLTTYGFYQLFALYQAMRPGARSAPDTRPAHRLELPAVLFYGITAAGYVAMGLSQNTAGNVVDPAGVIWQLRDLYAVTALIACFTMGTLTLLSLVRLIGTAPATSPNTAASTTTASDLRVPVVDRGD